MNLDGLKDILGHFVDYPWTPRTILFMFVAQSIYDQFVETIQSRYIVESSSVLRLLITTVMTFLLHLSYLRKSEYTWTELRADLFLLIIPPIFVIKKSRSMLRNEVSNQNEYIRGVFYGSILLAGIFLVFFSIILTAIFLTNPTGGLLFLMFTLTIGPLSYAGVIIAQISEPVFGRVLEGRFNRSIILLFGILIFLLLLF